VKVELHLKMKMPKGNSRHRNARKFNFDFLLKVIPHQQPTPRSKVPHVVDLYSLS
jgi:hypothetical protein